MIFQHTLEPVLTGQKTQTRRLAKAGETAVYDADHALVEVRANGRVKYRVGGTYAVQPSRNMAAVARIRLLAIEQKRANDVSAAEARAEGYAHPDDFLAAWQAIHGTNKRSVPVWVLTFELVAPDD